MYEVGFIGRFAREKCTFKETKVHTRAKNEQEAREKVLNSYDLEVAVVVFVKKVKKSEDSTLLLK